MLAASVTGNRRRGAQQCNHEHSRSLSLARRVPCARGVRRLRSLCGPRHDHASCRATRSKRLAGPAAADHWPRPRAHRSARRAAAMPGMTQRLSPSLATTGQPVAHFPESARSCVAAPSHLTLHDPAIQVGELGTRTPISGRAGSWRTRSAESPRKDDAGGFCSPSDGVLAAPDPAHLLGVGMRPRDTTSLACLPARPRSDPHSPLRTADLG